MCLTTLLSQKFCHTTTMTRKTQLYITVVFSDYVGLGIVAVMTIDVCRNLSKSSVIFHFNVNFPSPNLTKVICLLNASAALVAKVASQ